MDTSCARKTSVKIVITVPLSTCSQFQHYVGNIFLVLSFVTEKLAVRENIEKMHAIEER